MEIAIANSDLIPKLRPRANPYSCGGAYGHAIIKKRIVAYLQHRPDRDGEALFQPRAIEGAIRTYVTLAFNGKPRPSSRKQYRTFAQDALPS